MLNRRNILIGMAGAPLLAGCWSPLLAADGKVRRLVLVELNGGNDGLNTVVPFADPLYRKLRPNLAVSADQVLRLDERTGLHPALEPLMPAFSEGQLAVVQGVGYEQANRSHFRSIEIWDTGSGPDVMSGEGWLNRIGRRDALGSGLSLDAVVIGRNPLPVSGGALEPVVMTDATRFAVQSERLGVVQGRASTAALRHLIRVQTEIVKASKGLASERPSLQARFAPQAISQDLAEAARILRGAPLAPIVKVALPGFDTHARQVGTHQHQLRLLAEGLAKFREVMLESGDWGHTLVMTYSEFGRRAQENGSQGTDHGGGSVLFVLGGAVKGGLYGVPPNLSDLVNGDVRSTVDYRRVYNSILAGWWGLTNQQIDAQRYSRLPFI